MDASTIAIIVAAVAGPISGVVVALIANGRSKRVDDGKREVATTKNNSELVGVLVEGFTEQVRLANERSARIEASNTEMAQKINDLELKNLQLERRIDERDDLKASMLQHIIKLEAMVPNPPGPPTRPFS